MERLRAPELEPALAWLGTTRKIGLRELRGHVVILDFWTACCVNCMHVIPVLRDLERRFADRPVFVIGVHSAKFPGEAAPERVADAIARHGVEHPVVVDRDMGIWERYAVRSWPTLVVLRPDGTIAAVAPGEPDPQALDAFVRGLLDEAERAGTLAAAPFRAPREAPPPARPLAFPGKLALAADGRVAVADSGHHRVLVLAPDGAALAAIGSGRRGHVDGDLASARFDDPQGLAWSGEHLWICDVRNHALRRADLASGSVDTVAGTGSMGQKPIAAPAPARTTALRSPWDALSDGPRVLVCLAGSHQLGVLAPDGAGGYTVGRLAGDGREALVDGPPDASCYAQPSGLCRAGDTLYVADSETSAVRALDLASGATRTLVGAGLFDFGAEDGPVASARLQHPLGVAALPDGTLVIADTYNDRLRRLDPVAGEVTTLYFGTGERGLREPGAVVVRPDGGLLVADTGNHRLVKLSAYGAWEGELEVRGAPAPEPAEDGSAPPLSAAGAATRWFDTRLAALAPLAPGPGLLRLRLRAPAGWTFNAGAPLQVTLEVSRRSDLLTLPTELVREGDGASDMVLEAALAVEHLPEGEVRSEVLVRVDAILCGEDVCAPSQAWLRIPLTLASLGVHAVGVELELVAPG